MFANPAAYGQAGNEGLQKWLQEQGGTEAGGAAVGGAAASAGGAAAAAPYIGVLMSFLKKRQDDRDQRKQMQAQIMGQNAAALGAPSGAGLQASELLYKQRMAPGTDYVAPLLKQYGYG